MSRRARKHSKAQATIEASLAIAQEHAELIEQIIRRDRDNITERSITDLDLRELRTRTEVQQ